ncbi:MAG: bacillithiol biosynthesis cysteine-adding enzyme BshC [Ignavibacteriales bacterium]|nr:MAG: bacillithiol biosynthesis cysteine-adding enzyme BshC [Ignavibacteriaceae bacterium]MBW7873992.1 bacillithiol biosynthesis cysteine-adding enzyme BshC [Ignavibacteria bacterium]MCZ2143093.1 bacillithiol biosynthesis cysteine-adding enzyme BshC [Ignavibacteriales bacterium]OQY78764.1 MAG: bacillithiol biosynthesis cysteine-adding enzyme BshC [Ignavibacteriales bacterium UTCHB3]MBV6443974.1 putative cysteine ligase BshC [Ignavibacteriaceae bacterium]
MNINFRDIPGQSPLFLDYLYNFKNVAKYYIKDFRNEQIYEPHFRDVLSKYPTDRRELAAAIKNQYLNKRISVKTSRNIKFLEEKNTLVIATGQQLGIAGGPLYTIYKTISAIKLAADLTEKFPDFNFVPVFWLAGDDHDFREIQSINVINKESKLEKITYSIDEDPEKDFGSVGSMILESDIEDFFTQLRSSLRETEFTNDVITFLSGIYEKGRTIADSFTEMMYKFFDKYGLVICNPQTEEIKRLLIPVFRHEIENYRTHASKLIQVSAGLDEEYHAQVKIRPINIFINNETGRHLLDPLENDEFRLKRKKVKFTKDELLQLLETSPEIFSANVILRPICQDYLFPTAFYIGGPAEVAYFAQIVQLYKMFNLATPIAYPRLSATIVEKSVQTLLQRFGITIEDFFKLKREIFNKVASMISEYDIDGKFQDAEGKLAEVYDDLKNYLADVENTLADPVEKSKIKALQHLSDLKAKAEAARLRKHENTMNRLDKSYALLLPENNLQERELNYFYFANKYGLGFFEYLIEKLQINEHDHSVIFL